MTTISERSTPTAPTRLPYEPSLDGLRGLALLAIIVYHSGLSWAPGAFLSVSTFFTLSGFLITSLMLAERQRTGTVSLSSFWSRRLRRLLPASLLAIALITLLAALLADSTQLARLRADGLAALGYVANWRFILAGDSYAAGFDSPSPFTHFWTLAIEEQLYITLPLVVAGILVALKGSRRALAVALSALVAASLWWSLRLESSGSSTDRLYFGTDVRAAELLVGALLAVWWMRRAEPLGPRTRRVLGIVGPLALVVMLLSWATADLHDRYFYRGGLLAYSLVTCAVILGCLSGAGPLRRVAGWRPLVWIGTISYGAYLLHYPVLLWLGQRSSWPALVRLILALPLVLGLAALSARWFEGPIRSGRWPRSAPAAAMAAVGGVLAVALVVLGVTALRQPADQLDLDAAAQWQRFVEQTEAQQRSDAPRIGLYGDSSALMTSRGLSSLSLEDPDQLVTTAGWTSLGCGVLTGGDRIVRGERVPADPACEGWEQRWERASSDAPSDLAVVQLGPWEVVDQQLEPGGPVRSIGDPAFDKLLLAQLRSATEVLLRDNARVVFLAPPRIDVGRVDGRSVNRPFDESDPARIQRFGELLVQVAEGDPRVSVVPTEEWYPAATDDDLDRRLRPDGVHLTDRTSLEVAPRLSAVLLQLHREMNGSDRTTVGRSGG